MIYTVISTMSCFCGLGFWNNRVIYKKNEEKSGG